MPTIKERIAEMNGKPFYSFEYFPPKTPAGEFVLWCEFFLRFACVLFDTFFLRKPEISSASNRAETQMQCCAAVLTV